MLPIKCWRTLVITAENQCGRPTSPNSDSGAGSSTGGAVIRLGRSRRWLGVADVEHDGYFGSAIAALEESIGPLGTPEDSSTPIPQGSQFNSAVFHPA